MNNTLKCPFCGYDQTRIETYKVRDHYEYAVMCLNCRAFGPNDLGKSGAVEMWNMRRKKYPPDTARSEEQQR